MTKTIDFGEIGGVVEWTSEWGHLLDLHARGELVLVVGSGVSQFAPSSVPVASNLSRVLRRLLLRSIPAELRHRAAAETVGVPFEVLVGRLKELDDDLAYSTVEPLIWTEAPNLIHRQIADLLVSAVDNAAPFSVITTNYDQGLQLAARLALGARGLGAQEISEVVSPADLGPQGRPEIFYVHGFIDNRASLVLDFRDEFAIGTWRTTHIRHILRGRTVLLLGFSGGDLDVSEALADARPGALYWVHQRAASFDTSKWPAGARRLLGVVPPDKVTVLATNGMTEKVLDPSTPYGSLHLDRRAMRDRLKSVFHSSPEAGPSGRDLAELWSGWLALRAGVTGMEFPVVRKVEELLSHERALEVASFGSYYAGTYRKAAALQRDAASKAMLSRSLPLYIYHRNLEVEYLNRGALTPLAWRSLAQAAFVVANEVRRKGRGAADDAAPEIRELILSVALAWPVTPVLAMLGRASMPLVRGTASLTSRSFDRGMVLAAVTARLGSPEFAEAEDRYRWLGQRLRLVNLYRMAALNTLRDGRADAHLVRLAVDYSTKAAEWADEMDDNFTVAKTRLVAMEAKFALARQVDPARRLPRRQAMHEWKRIARSDLWRPVLEGARLAYFAGALIGGNSGQVTRLVALTSLETA